MKRIVDITICFVFLLLPLSHFSQSSNQKETITKYFRHLRYNHVSPHVPLKGIHEISKETASKTSHYVFKYTRSNKLVEIVNYNYHGKRHHPLATIGAHKIVFNYTDHDVTRIFLDINGNRMTNDRAVYKEVYKFDKKKFIYALDFYDLDDKPMESNWNITSYKWTKTKNMVIEHRYNLKDKLVDISPYFEFGITGIVYRKDGSPKINYNLNEKLEIRENSVGVASYRDTYDNNGNHITYSYHNKKGELTLNPWGYAVAKQEFDEFGYHTIRLQYDENNKLIKKFKYPNIRKISVASPASVEDTLAIKEMSLGYLIALQKLKPELMKRVFHKELAKRTIGYDRDNKKQIIRETSYDQMVSFAESWNQSGTKFPPKPSNNIKILDIYDHIATVKLFSDNWVEYLHLTKTNGQWQIINLLWQDKNSSRYAD
ncbi:nuclear transport factor 2 family protein [Aquimarina aggregata]|uniref:nuclear transport factor 2 family protein n=1 Tax=Aquimarina aggregata TaxID=1642818 RepID=UPI0024938C68|nr:nuclear transport factor 2 family protein [Aquimarina aggregata]